MGSLGGVFVSLMYVGHALYYSYSSGFGARWRNAALSDRREHLITRIHPSEGAFGGRVTT